MYKLFPTILVLCFISIFLFTIAHAIDIPADTSKCRGKPTCEWSFGDGETSPGCGRQNHVYEEPGTYTATFRYDCGCLSQATTHEINVTAGYSWITDSWSNCQDACGESLKTRSVSCERQDDVLVDMSKCDNETKPDLTDICTDYSTCTYSWEYGEWNVPEGCGKVTATRPYECLRSDGTIIADSECESRIGAANATDTRTVHDACTYSWNEHGDWSECSADPTWSDWSDCSAECGGGNQTRTCQDTEGTQSQTVTCVRDQTDKTVADSYCSGEKPDARSCTESCTGDSTRACNTQDCVDCSEECGFSHGWGYVNRDNNKQAWVYAETDTQINGEMVSSSDYEIWWNNTRQCEVEKNENLGNNYDYTCENSGYEYYKNYETSRKDLIGLGIETYHLYEVCRKPVSCFN